MTTPANERAVGGGPPPMTAERRAGRGATRNTARSCEPAKRDAFVTDACGYDADLRREVASLLAAHDSSDHAFLERPAAEALGTLGTLTPPVPVADRLATALA